MKRRKIILYNPKSVFYTMPLGLLSVASGIDPRRFEIRIVDGRLEKDPAASILAELEEALLFGVTVLTGAPIHDALYVSRRVKQTRPDLPVVWGGWHPSFFPVETLKEGSVDITVQGQGEVTFREIVEHLAAGALLDEVAGLAHEGSKGPVRNRPRPLTDMDALPAHDYSLVPVTDYFRLKKRKQLDYISSTGCFWRCAFCADPFVFKRKWTALSPERMVEEIHALHARYAFDEVAFQDETFFTYSKRVMSILEEFRKRDLKVRWTATMRGDQGERLSEDEFRELAEGGMHRLLIGVESGSQEMLDWMKKDTTIEQIQLCAERCVRYGVGVTFPFIVGFPGETRESFNATLRLARVLRSMSPDFDTPVFYFKPYPGSELTEAAVREGYRLPETLDEWADFDFVGSSGPWVSREKFRTVERFKFYNRIAGSRDTVVRRPLQKLARWRCRRERFGFPVEKLVVETLRPAPRLS